MWDAGDDEEVRALGDAPPVIDDGVGRWSTWLEALRRRAGLDHRAVAWAAAALVAAGLGLWLLRPAPGPVEEALPMAATSSLPAAASSGSTSAPAATAAEASGAGSDATVPTAESVPAEVVVHAAGAVRSPGVYSLAPGARVDELVQAAGGLAADADGSRLNLAAPLADGARLYVPRIGEIDPPPVVGADGGGGAPVATDDGGGAAAGGEGAEGSGPPALVDLNTATEEELDTLPGVGPSIAAAILAFREENGGFASVEDLLDVRGIGEARLAELRPLVTV